MKQKIALAGTPNCGKTTLWNLSTGRRGKTGNWPGVTSEKLSAALKAFPDTELIDLPGMYSLSAKSLEEASTIKFLENGEVLSLIIIVDGTKPEQGFYLALELLSLGIPAVIGINYADELRAQNVHVDTEKLCEEFGVPVFLISAKKNENTSVLISAARENISTFAEKRPPLSSEKRRAKAARLSEKYFSKRKTSPVSEFFKLIPAVIAFAALILFFVFFESVLKNNISVLFEHATALISALMNYLHAPPVLKSLISGALIPGTASAVSFIPELSVLYFAIAFLEDSGCMARFAFASDYLFKKIGLSGRSVIPLLLGFGCTVPAVYAAKSSDSETARNRTLSMLMFIPCSARLPLFLLICETFFPKFGGSAVLFFYFIIISLGAVFSLIQNRREDAPFIFELPAIRIPSVISILKTTLRRLKSFVTKAFGMVVLTSVLIWMLENFSIFLESVELKSESALYTIGSFIAPLFSPIGIPYEGAVALFCGLFAKESALFALVSLCGDVGSLFSPVSAVSFLLFFLIYSPCLACLFSIGHEFGAKKAVLLFIRQTALAYFISLFFYQFALLMENIFIR